MTQRQPAEAFPPGQFIQDEMVKRGWSVKDLAQKIDESDTFVYRLLDGDRGISPATAKKLAAAFGTSPVFWANLETAYQLWRTR